MTDSSRQARGARNVDESIAPLIAGDDAANFLAARPSRQFQCGQDDYIYRQPECDIDNDVVSRVDWHGAAHRRPVAGGSTGWEHQPLDGKTGQTPCRTLPCARSGGSHRGGGRPEPRMGKPTTTIFLGEVDVNFTASSKDTLIERRSIDPIPEGERHGSLLSQFTLWVSANLTAICAVTGALSVVLGGDVFWSIVGLFVGQVVGGAVMALHGAQGPQTGLPQMILSRAQFGIYGAIIPLSLVCVMYIGFLTSGTMLTSQVVGKLFHLNPKQAIVMLGAIVTMLALFGYRAIHAIGRFYSVIGGLMFVYLLFSLMHGHNATLLLANRHFTWSSFLLAVSLSASWQITYGPYVADYSRYLPASTSSLKVFFAVGLGSVIGSQIAMTFGVFAAALAGNHFGGHEVTYMVDIGAGGIAAIAAAMYLTILLAKLIASTLCVYGGFMSVATMIAGLSGKNAIGFRARVILIVAVVATYTVLALIADDGFLRTFRHFILFLLAFFTPWSAINLVDYYCLSREPIDIIALSDVNGRYGKWNVRGIAIYVIGVLAQIPFMSTDLYTGPLFHLFGDIDVSWIVGLVLSGTLYYFVSRKRHTRRDPQPERRDSV